MASFIFFLLTAGISGFIGWHARNFLGLPSQLEKSLSAELLATNNKLKNYQLDVHHHFEKTADLFNQMLRQSKHLHEYLLSSSKELCHSEATISSTNIVNTDPHNWQEIVIKSYAPKNLDTVNIDHNWHPTFFEARDASGLKVNTKKHDKDLDTPDFTEGYYNDPVDTQTVDAEAQAQTQTQQVNKKTDVIDS